MKILQIANGDFFSTYGGGQVYVKNLVDEMINQEMDVVVFSFVNKKPDVSFQKQNYKGIDLYEIYQKDENIIKTLVRQIIPDIIHIHSEKAFIVKISRELSVLNVVTAHHGGIFCPAGALLNYKDEICRIPASQKNCTRCVLRNTKAGKYFYPLIKQIPLSVRLKMGNALVKLPFIYFVTPILSTNLYIENKRKEWEAIIENTDRMIAPSSAIANRMVLNRFPQEKIEIVPHGIPAHGIVSQACHDDVPLKFFYVGSLGYIKGIHLLLKAFSQLDASLCELHLVGDTKGRYEQKLLKQYKSHSNIFFHGKVRQEEVSKWICQWDILVHPAICLDVFGLNIGEALLQGKPVIASRCGGAEMQVEDKENGLLIEPDNVIELRNAMQWTMDNPEERKKMSENAPKKVVSMEKHVKNIMDLYQKLKLHK